MSSESTTCKQIENFLMNLRYEIQKIEAKINAFEVCQIESSSVCLPKEYYELRDERLNKIAEREYLTQKFAMMKIYITNN